MSNNPLTHEQFAQRLGSEFTIHVEPDAPVEVHLVEVSEFKQSPVQESFWLIFRGSLTRPLGQGTYGFEHQGMGRFDLFMTPIRRDENSFYYEAVFNRLREGVGESNG